MFLVEKLGFNLFTDKEPRLFAFSNWW